jgi:Protein of unknown function (DUF3300)
MKSYPIFRALIFVAMIAANIMMTASALAQTQDVSPAAPPTAPAQRSAADLEKLAAPMALYPDPLVAIMLPAAAYPVEIVQAARFVANTNNLATLDDQPWDDNVKAVAKFPSVIQNMSDQLGWTAELGQAFVQQPSELMDAIQSLRAKAQSVGTLQTTPQQIIIVTNAVVERTYETQIVYVTNTVVQIVPASPQVIYVPVYNPVVVYAPPPAYAYSPATSLIIFGAGITAGIIIANNHCDWHYGGVYYGRGTVVVWGGGRYPYYPPPPHYRPPPYYPPPGYRPPPPGYRPPGYPPRPTPYPANGSRPGTPSTLPANAVATPATMQRWQPDQKRMAAGGGASSLPSASTMEARGWSSGAVATTSRPTSNASTVNTWNKPATVSPQPARNNPVPSQTARPNTPAQSPNVTRPSPSQGLPPSSPNQPANRPSPSQPANRSAPSNTGQGSAFGGVGNGAVARDSSNRGAASRNGGQSSRGGNFRGGGQ